MREPTDTDLLPLSKPQNGLFYITDTLMVSVMRDLPQPVRTAETYVGLARNDLHNEFGSHICYEKTCISASSLWQATIIILHLITTNNETTYSKSLGLFCLLGKHQQRGRTRALGTES